MTGNWQYDLGYTHVWMRGGDAKQKSIDTTVSVTPLDANNKPYIFDDKNKTFVYEIMFPASSKEEDSIFNGPAVDDVTLIYMLNQAKILEYSSEMIQPRL